MRFCKYGLLVALLFVVTNLSASEDENLSSAVTMELGRDSSDTVEAYLNLDSGLKNGTHIKWMSGGTSLDAESDEYETESRSIGISSDYAAPFVAGFDYDYWGNPQTLETRTRRFKLGANTDNWYVQLVYEDRSTRFYTSGLVSLVHNYVEIGSIGRGGDISFYGFFPVSISVSYFEYDYERDMTGIAKNMGYLKRFYSFSTLGIATGLEAWRRSGDASYSLGWGTIGLSGLQSKSAVDESVASSGSIYLIWEVTRSWSSTFTLGASGVDTADDTVRFGRVALTHRW